MKGMFCTACVTIVALLLFCSCQTMPTGVETEEIPELLAELQNDLPSAATAIEIRCNVKKAYVFLNSEYQGQAPLTLRGLVPGTYTLFVEHHSYNSAQYTITVERGKALHFYVALQKWE